MNQIIFQEVIKAGLIILELILGFGFFWIGQFTYQKLYQEIDLNLELFVKDNPATAIALVGYYSGIVIALESTLGTYITTWQDKILHLITYGILIVILMLARAWIGNRLILRQWETAREIKEERNVGAALVEAGYYIANGLILSSSLAGDSGSWIVGLICWLIGLFTLLIAISIYPQITTYNVFAEIKNRNNEAAGVALMGFLIAIGNIVRVAFRAEFQNWITSFIYYGLTLIFCLVLLAGIRWFADLILVPGVKITDEIVRQEVPNLGAGLIEAFTYIAASFLIAWTF